MASFGAKYPYFCPVASEPDDALPVYSGKPVRIGRLVKADLTVTLASGELFADDVLAESVAEFASGSIAMETDDMEDKIASVVYGATEGDISAEVKGITVKNHTVCYSVGDDPTKGGLGYLKKLMRNKKVLYKGYFYPLVKAALGNDSAQTKGSSIAFGTTSTTFKVYACETGAWRFTYEAETEGEALEWLKAQFKTGSEPPAENEPGSEPPAENEPDAEMAG